MPLVDPLSSVYCSKEHINAGCASDQSTHVDTISAAFSIETCYWQCENQDCIGWVMDWATGSCDLYDGVCNRGDEAETDFYSIDDCGKCLILNRTKR